MQANTQQEQSRIHIQEQVEAGYDYMDDIRGLGRMLDKEPEAILASLRTLKPVTLRSVKTVAGLVHALCLAEGVDEEEHKNRIASTILAATLTGYLPACNLSPLADEVEAAQAVIH